MCVHVWQGECGMSVMTNTKYVKLLEVLSPEEAEQVLIFASCQSAPDASLKLANRPKAERTKVLSHYSPCIL